MRIVYLLFFFFFRISISNYVRYVSSHLSEFCFQCFRKLDGKSSKSQQFRCGVLCATFCGKPCYSTFLNENARHHIEVCKSTMTVWKLTEKAQSGMMSAQDQRLYERTSEYLESLDLSQQDNLFMSLNSLEVSFKTGETTDDDFWQQLIESAKTMRAVLLVDKAFVRSCRNDINEASLWRREVLCMFVDLLQLCLISKAFVERATEVPSLLYQLCRYDQSRRLIDRMLPLCEAVNSKQTEE